MVRRYVGPPEAGASRRADADAHLGVATTGLLLLARISPCAPDHRSWARSAEWDGTSHSLAAFSSYWSSVHRRTRNERIPWGVFSSCWILRRPLGGGGQLCAGSSSMRLSSCPTMSGRFLGRVNAMPFALSRTFARPKRSSRDDGALVLGIGLFPCSILRMSQRSGQAMVDRVEQGSALEVVQHAD